MSITEVTCAQYQEFLKATLDAPPAGWLGGQFPADAAEKPVTNIPAAKAMAYCTWLAKRKGWAPQSVTLPSHAEFLRAVRGRTTRGEPQSPTFWRRSLLGQGTGPLPVRQAQFDKIFIPESAQMYDLIGNAAEWGREEKGGQRAVLGGDYAQTNPTFNPLEARWVPAETISPTIGFRFVHLLPQ
jgi:formylglycine-generating enzyme required for sulfatase activity